MTDPFPEDTFSLSVEHPTKTNISELFNEPSENLYAKYEVLYAKYTKDIKINAQVPGSLALLSLFPLIASF